MKVVITGANSAVGQAILRCAAAQEAPSTTFLAAVRSDRAAEQIRSGLGDAHRVVRITYDHPGSLPAALRGASGGIHLGGILFRTPASTDGHGTSAANSSVVEATK